MRLSSEIRISEFLPATVFAVCTPINESHHLFCGDDFFAACILRGQLLRGEKYRVVVYSGAQRPGSGVVIPLLNEQHAGLGSGMRLETVITLTGEIARHYRRKLEGSTTVARN